jgi:hypothetical protein
MSELHFPEPHTEAEKRAIEILKNAKLETDEDYRNLIHLLDENGAIDKAESEER